MKISKETLAELQEQGYSSLKEYFSSLSEEYDIDICTVEALANILGEDELFDGLVNAVEDDYYENSLKTAFKAF